MSRSIVGRMGQAKCVSSGKREQVLSKIRVGCMRVLPVITDPFSGHHPALGQNQIEEQISVERRLWDLKDRENLDLED
ncbi:hypothetical protein TNCV_4091651 [Trichonephila clavipes]|nr:hypothetical protein TNCV_4091651 [Trichonephila clavipes]